MEYNTCMLNRNRTTEYLDAEKYLVVLFNIERKSQPI